MHRKIRTEPIELQIFRALNTRMNLSEDEKQYYLNLKKGYEGERMFDSLTAGLDSQFYILNDLLLESNNTTFQIDSLLISQDAIIPCEVKNYEGNYFYQNDNFYKCSSKRELTNPLHQLNRVETLLRHFLRKHGFPFLIKGYLIFINPEFFLYQAPQNEKIIFPPQLSQFLKSLSTRPSKLNHLHLKLANQLANGHITKPPYTRLPAYQYDQLQKGVLCTECFSFMRIYTQRRVVCKGCGAI